jgi:DNA polymerase epsilon subunit 1
MGFISTFYLKNPEQIQFLIDNVKRTMQRAIEVEEKVALSLTVNFDEVCNEIIEKLSMLRDCPNRLENPLIYHLVVFHLSFPKFPV